MMPNVVKDVKQLELQQTAGKNFKWYDHFGKLFGTNIKLNKDTHTYDEKLNAYINMQNKWKHMSTKRLECF